MEASININTKQALVVSAEFNRKEANMTNKIDQVQEKQVARHSANELTLSLRVNKCLCAIAAFFAFITSSLYLEPCSTAA
jgi:hypothetical protein